MEIILTRSKAVVIGSVLVFAVVALGVKQFCFPPLDEKYFQLDYDRLREAPANVFVFRPTHYPRSSRNGVIVVGPRQDTNSVPLAGKRLLGRDATAREAIAAAYGCRLARVVMPADSPTNRFDFIVTTANPRERLRKALMNKLGCTIQWQDRDTDVFELRVRIPNAPGLRPSIPGQVEWQFTGNLLHWTHARVAWLADRIEESMDKPVVDKTGLNGFYDFSFAWNWRGNYTDADREALTNSLGALGLQLEPDSESLSMLVVERKK